MPIVEDIRRMDREGISTRQIAKTLGVSRESVTKYARMEDLSMRVPASTPRRGSSPWVITSEVGVFIDQILQADKNAPRKQRHTAKRIYDRLVAERGFTGLYRRVCEYVRSWKQDHQSMGSSFAELSWSPGSAQVDFGQISCLDAQGGQETWPMLVVSLPFSNARYAQVCLGETAECVAHG
jgi:transposase